MLEIKLFLLQESIVRIYNEYATVLFSMLCQTHTTQVIAAGLVSGIVLGS